MTAADITQLHLHGAAQLPVQLKCTFNFQRVASCFSAEANRNGNIVKCKTSPMHVGSKCISFAPALRTSGERPN